MAVGCAPNHGDAFPKGLAAAERAETAGRFEEASTLYDKAADEAIRDRDRDHARYLAGLMLLRAGNVRDGIARLTAVAEANPPHEDSPEAAYKVALARVNHGDPETGYHDMEWVMRHFPASGVAHPALRHLLVHVEETQGKPAALAYARALGASPLGETELGELIAFQIGERLNDVGDFAAAHDQFLSVAQRWPYPKGALFDNSLWRASEMDEKLGRYAHGVDDLRVLLKEREVIGPTVPLKYGNLGSYQRPKMSPAMIRIAFLQADKMNDRASARATLHSLYADMQTSALRDDALWFEAELWRADGDTKTSCDRLETLVGDFPSSRYVPCASEVCADVKRPEKSDAPKTCHPYLLRPGRLAKVEGM